LYTHRNVTILPTSIGISGITPGSLSPSLWVAALVMPFQVSPEKGGEGVSVGSLEVPMLTSFATLSHVEGTIVCLALVGGVVACNS